MVTSHLSRCLSGVNRLSISRHFWKRKAEFREIRAVPRNSAGCLAIPIHSSRPFPGPAPSTRLRVSPFVQGARSGGSRAGAYGDTALKFKGRAAASSLGHTGVETGGLGMAQRGRVFLRLTGQAPALCPSWWMACKHDDTRPAVELPVLSSRTEVLGPHLAWAQDVHPSPGPRPRCFLSHQGQLSLPAAVTLCRPWNALSSQRLRLREQRGGQGRRVCGVREIRPECESAFSTLSLRSERTLLPYR